ncbi:MAG: ABC-type transport system involved in multi-copper enzyme maturation permease subunit [Planctomycetota bacterium]|jgi:ABC-type transport system involved in multi-copper enzyme maturation permease subunit
MWREARFYAWRSLGFFVVLELLLVGAILWWPQFSENIGSIKAIASPIPMLAAMVDTLEQGGVSAYVVGQHFFKGCNTLGAAAAVLFAMGAVAGEAHRGTLELWLARPVSRARLLTERYVLGWLAVAIPIFASSMTVPALLNMHDESMPVADLLRCSLHQSVFLGALYSITFFFSSFGQNPTKIAFVTLFLSIFQFAIYMVKTITHWSLFRLADVDVFMKITLSGSLVWSKMGPLIAVHVLAYVGSRIAFARRVP